MRMFPSTANIVFGKVMINLKANFAPPPKGSVNPQNPSVKAHGFPNQEQPKSYALDDSVKKSSEDPSSTNSKDDNQGVGIAELQPKEHDYGDAQQGLVNTSTDNPVQEECHIDRFKEKEIQNILTNVMFQRK